jgi:hypothetical protein
MEKYQIIERYGGVLKEEPLSCLDNDLIYKNNCVLEAVSPYFGYYNEASHSSQPHMLYFVLADYYSLEKLMRATVKIQKKVKFPIDAVSGTISMFNQTCYVIRLLDLQNYSHISMLQELYEEEGLMFKKREKIFKNEMALIKLRRFFVLKSLGDGLYLEDGHPNIGFFEIPRHIPWDEFKAITTEAKYDTDILYFDAALAYTYEHCKIGDMVRIYREHLTEDKLRAIRHRYLKLIGE